MAMNNVAIIHFLHNYIYKNKPGGRKSDTCTYYRHPSPITDPLK